MRSPIVCKLKFSFLGGGIATETVPVDDEGHVSAVLAEQAETLHVCLHDVTRTSGSRDLI